MTNIDNITPLEYNNNSLFHLHKKA